jgi:hypothetical protein
MEKMTLLQISIKFCFQKQLKDWAGSIRQEKEDIEKQLEESRVKEMHIKSMNKVRASVASVATLSESSVIHLHILKTLKEEIKKVTRSTPVLQLASSPTSSRSSSPSIKPSSPTTPHNLREDLGHRGMSASANDVTLNGSKSPVNLEYLKHIVIGFMENRQTRVSEVILVMWSDPISNRVCKAQLIPVLSMLLKLSPDETKRLQSAA